MPEELEQKARLIAGLRLPVVAGCRRVPLFDTPAK